MRSIILSVVFAAFVMGCNHSQRNDEGMVSIISDRISFIKLTGEEVGELSEGGEELWKNVTEHPHGYYTYVYTDSSTPSFTRCEFGLSSHITVSCATEGSGLKEIVEIFSKTEGRVGIIEIEGGVCLLAYDDGTMQVLWGEKLLGLEEYARLPAVDIISKVKLNSYKTLLPRV